MKQGNIISALLKLERAELSVKDAIEQADNEALQHAALYAYTNGSGNIEKDGDSQSKLYKRFREKLRYYSDKTVTFNKSEGVFEFPVKGVNRGTAANTETSDDGSDTSNADVNESDGNKSPEKVSGYQDNIARLVDSLTEHDKARIIIEQMNKLDVSFETLYEVYADYAATQAEES